MNSNENLKKYFSLIFTKIFENVNDCKNVEIWCSFNREFTIEKINRKWEKVLVLSKFCWYFEKKLGKYSEKFCGSLKTKTKKIKKLE